MDRQRNTIKFYNFSIILICIVFVVMSAAINFTADPYNIFKTFRIKKFNLLKPCETKQQRITKIPQLKLYKNNIDILYVGSSKTDWWLNTDYHSKLSGKNVYSMALSSSSLQESIIMAKNSIFLHPEIKKIYFGIDFFSFAQGYYDTAVDVDLIKEKNLTKTELLPLLISLDTINYSIQTIITNIKSATPTAQADSSSCSVNNPKAEYYFKQTIKKYKKEYYGNYKLNKNAFSALKDFNNFAKQNNVEVVFFVTPSHIADLINIYNNNIWDDYKTFKKELANMFDYYDLASINKYNTEPVNSQIKYFRDAVHATYLLGEKFALNFYTTPNDSAVLITKKNINSYLQNEDIKLKNYLQDNPQTVKQIEEYSDNAF